MTTRSCKEVRESVILFRDVRPSVSGGGVARSGRGRTPMDILALTFDELIAAMQPPCREVPRLRRAYKRAVRAETPRGGS